MSLFGDIVNTVTSVVNAILPTDGGAAAPVSDLWADRADAAGNDRVIVRDHRTGTGSLSLEEAADRLARGDTSVLNDPSLKEKLKDPLELMKFQALFSAVNRTFTAMSEAQAKSDRTRDGIAKNFA